MNFVTAFLLYLVAAALMDDGFWLETAVVVLCSLGGAIQWNRKQ